MELWAAEIKLRATRRIGELSAELETQQGPIRSNGGTNTKSEALEAAGLSKATAWRAEQIAAIPEAKFEAYLAEKKKAGKEVTAHDVIRKVIAREKQEQNAATGGWSTGKRFVS